MSTPTPPSFEEIKGYLNQIGYHLLNAQTPLLPDHKPTAEQRYLERLDGILKRYREQFLSKAKTHYQGLANSDLKTSEGQALLNTLKNTLNTHLMDMDLREQIDGKSLKSYMTFEAGFTALEHEARLGVQDRLLHPQEGTMLESVALPPSLRPGLYALQFSYQAQQVELAGAFVATEKNSVVVNDLMSAQDVGQVLLFTPARGIESFNTLAELNTHLRQNMEHASGRSEFIDRLPTRYHALSPAGIWPLELSPIDDQPLFEHTFGALIAKRTQDIDRALSLVDNPQHDPAQLIAALDRAIRSALPDLSARLELRAQRLLERLLRYSAPDWYRSASEAHRATLAEHLASYNQARQHLLDLLGPAANPQALARFQWLERLSDDLEIHDLNPEHLQVKTQRLVPGVGHYEHNRNLIDLALRGLHTGDELPGSDFLTKTTFTYNGAPLPDAYQDLTPAWIVQQSMTLQPRFDFAQVQRELHARPEFSSAIEQMLDQRINALAYTAFLQGHIREDDYQAIQRLRLGTDVRLSAATLGASVLSLHGAQLQDLWVMRQTDANGTVNRVLLCTPEAPQEHQFQAFDSELACRQHILGWTQDNGLKAPPGTMTDYLIRQVPLRLRNSMKHLLNGLSLKFHAQDYNKITFNAGNYRQSLKSMADHVLATRIDNYEFNTPSWYRSATIDVRRRLSTLAEDAEGSLQTYNDHPQSEARFPSFDAYLHEKARERLNQLLGRRQNDVDPDTVWAYSPSALGTRTPAPMTYTRLYRDGYADGVGFLDEKFSRSARYRGPQGVDLSTLNANPQAVARSVTGVWIGQRYVDKVKAELLDPGSPAFTFRRNAVLAITQRQMLSAALECRLQGHIAGVDLQWLERCIASMGDTSPQTRGNYAIHRLLVDGEWVIDTYLFSHADNPVLFYTPHAPDGITFREASRFNYLLKKLPGFIDYLAQRVDVRSRGRVQAFLETAKQGLPESLDKTTPSPPRYDSTRALPPVLDLRRLLYNMKLQRKIDEVTATTTDRTQMITSMLWTCVEFMAAIATAPFPVLSLSVGLLLAFKDGMLALHAYNQGDTSAALEHFAGYLFNSAGALFTDLRPALKSFKPIGNSGRLAVASTEQGRAMKLISQLETAPPAAADIQPVWFNGEVLWAPKTPDAIGRYLLYRHDPVSGKWVSTTRLAAPNAEGFWTRTGVSGGAPKYETVPETPGPSRDYGMPQKYWSRLEPVMDPQMRTLMINQAANTDQGLVGTVLGNAADELSSLRTVYLQQVERLTRDADNFFLFLDTLPARASVPVVEASTPLARLVVNDAFAGNRNLVIGAVPGSIASKQALIANMAALVEQGFKRLYVEFLPGDVFKLKLEKLNQGKSWRHIKKHLKAIDQSFGIAQDAEYSYLALVRKAREKGVQIKALDASTSYRLDDVLLMGDSSPTTPQPNSLRNYYSHKVIEADMADAPHERWIALVDRSRMTTYNGTPGLADLTNAVALRVEDVGLNQSVGIWSDTLGKIPGDGLAKGDYHMTLQTPYKPPQPISAAAATSVVSTGHFNDFDIAPSLRNEIARMSDQPHGLDTRYPPHQRTRAEAFSEFIKLRKDLNTKAESFFADYVPPARPALPTISSSTTPESFLKQISESRLPGLVIGEAHSAESSKAFLKKHMKQLKQQGYKTLYVEHLLTDLHQAELEAFHQTQRFSDKLKAYLKAQDRGHMLLYTGSDNYSEVIQAANKYGIRIRALDCTASYHLKGLPDPEKARNQMFNYFASRVILADQAAHGPHKWIAFIGSAHTNNYQGVSGLAEILGTVSLHVRDCAPSLSRGIHLGYWETDLTGPGWRAIRSDFKLEVSNARQRVPEPFAPVDRSRLRQTRHFLIERPSAAETNLLHRSRSGEIVSTPIQVDDNGLFFIDRWDMTAQRFKYQDMLIGALKADIGLTPAP
ncbi:membrane-targeted effector domain-containing toxin [Pseudomonas sp. A-B-19]|uniref:membrane-targeted effector domain-containing toxin n=1 Tax=Pseudomonas sp. A-B-19 TaxID=2832405 RepID=UPI001CBDBD14|nr:membrane-targeted effector domain-containing toxin [Pseudomonas sp. A-B-19]